MTMLTKVITDFQTGWNIAAIRAAARVGIATGGWIPRGFRTLEARKNTHEIVLRPEYAELYGAQESPSVEFSQPVLWNVRDADVTVLFAWSDTQGTLAVTDACERLGREPLRFRFALRPDTEKPGQFFLIDRGGWEADQAAKKEGVAGATGLPGAEADVRRPESVAAFAKVLADRLDSAGGEGVLNITGNRMRHFEVPAEAFLIAVFREMLALKGGPSP